MKVLVVYDSNFGNTKKIAEAIARALGDHAIVESVSEFTMDDLDTVDLFVVGSPINGWRPTQRTEKMLSSLKQNQLHDINAAAFDTRVKFFFHGDAAGQMTKLLRKAGAHIVSEPQGFFVNGKEGPLADGEIEHAKAWARSLKIH